MLSILDPTSLLGRGVAEGIARVFPEARRKLFHTSAGAEHLIAEIAGEAALVLPLVNLEELGGSDAVVITTTPGAQMVPGLLGWLRANPEVALIDISQPGVAPAEAISVLGAPPPGRRGAPWFHMVDPCVVAPARFFNALAPLQPRAMHVTTIMPASTFGLDAIEELAAQAASRLSGRSPRNSQRLPAVLAFDLHPAAPALRDALGRQLAELFPAAEMHLHALVAGVFHGNVASAAVWCEESFSETALATLLRRTPGMHVPRGARPSCASEAAGSDEIVCAGLRAEGRWATATLLADGLRLAGADAVLEILSALGSR